MRVQWEDGRRPKELREPDAIDVADLERLRKQHEAADHGVHAIEAMVYCYESRMHPPQWVVDWIGERFASWLDEQSDSLDKALHVASPGPGRKPPLRRVTQDYARSNDAHVMFVLDSVFSIPIGKAAYMVQRRNENQNRETPSAEWIAESYRKHWRKQFDAEARELFVELYQDEESRAAFLASFPEDVRPKDR